MSKVVLSEVEQARRRDGFAEAQVIVGAAGGHVSDEMKTLMERYISGELTADEVIEIRLAQSRR